MAFMSIQNENHRYYTQKILGSLMVVKRGHQNVSILYIMLCAS